MNVYIIITSHFDVIYQSITSITDLVNSILK